jgi:FkbM family methyltransferase
MKQLFPHHLRQLIKRRLFAVRDMQTRLKILRQAGFSCTGAVDAGAYRGDWTREFWNVFPRMPVLLVEPQPSLSSQLLTLAANTPGSQVLTAALSDKMGSAVFTLQETNSRIRTGESTDGESICVTCSTLVDILAARPEFNPNLLKLDLQGHELQAMRGAGDALSSFEVIIAEMSVIPIGDVPAFAEVNRFFELQGYKLYDVLPMYDRPLDGALWQLDAFYVRHGSPLIASNAWA